MHSWLCIILYVSLNVSEPVDCEKTPGGMSGGVSVCVSAVYTLTMQAILNFQHVSYIKKK